MLITTKFIDEFVVSVIKIVEKAWHSYDRRLVLIGISDLIQSIYLSSYVQPHLNNLITGTLLMIRHQIAEESSRYLKKDKKQITLEESSESDSEEESDDDDDINEVNDIIGKKENDIDMEVYDKLRTEIYRRLNGLQCQIKQVDEYSYFSYAIRAMLTNRKKEMDELIQGMTGETREMLKQAISMQRVNINMRNGLCSIARRIVKPKRPAKPT